MGLIKGITSHLLAIECTDHTQHGIPLGLSGLHGHVSELSDYRCGQVLTQFLQVIL